MNEHDLGVSTTSPGKSETERSDDLMSKGKETVSSVARSASEATRVARERGEELVREARERYPEAERYYRRGADVLRPYADRSLLALVVGVGLGFALAHLVNRWSERHREHVPDYARTR